MTTPSNIGEHAAEDDRLLDQCFVQTSSYERLLDGQYVLITGRKGAGKSALFSMMPKLEKWSSRWQNIVAPKINPFRFNDFAKDIETNPSLHTFSLGDVFFEAWLHFIYENVMKSVLKASDGGLRTGELATVHHYLSSIGQLEKDAISQLVSFFATFIGLIAELNIGKVQLRIGSAQRIREFFNQRYGFDKAVEALRRYLARTNQRVLFLMDDLDAQIHRESPKEVVGEFFRQLIIASLDIDRYKHTDDDRGFSVSHIQVKALIPTDIWEWLDMRHADKLGSRRFEITWTRDELFQMFTGRLRVAFGLGDMPLGDVLKKYFGASVFDVSGRERGGVFPYLLEHSFYRPRDFLRMYLCLRDHLSKDLYLDKDRDARNAVAYYINETYNSLVREALFSMPEFRDICERLRGGVAIWHVIGFYKKILEKVEGGVAAPVPDPERARLLLRPLYGLGMFGILRAAPATNSTPIYSLEVDFSYTAPDAYLSDEAIIVMHPVIRYALSLRNNVTTFFGHNTHEGR